MAKGAVPKPSEELILNGVIVLGCLFIASILSSVLDQRVAFEVTDQGFIEPLLDRLYVLAFVALLIERAVETYLNISGVAAQSVRDRENGVVYRLQPVSRVAATAALGLAIPVAALGLGVLDPVLSPLKDGCIGDMTRVSELCNPPTRLVLSFVNMGLTVGLLAGGADLIHQVIRLVPLSTDRVANAIKGLSGETGKPDTVLVANSRLLQALQSEILSRNSNRNAADRVEITIDSPPGEHGTLAVGELGLAFRWSNASRIAAGSYPWCVLSKQPGGAPTGIYIPGALVDGKVRGNVFIRANDGTAADPGCILLEPADMTRLLQALPATGSPTFTVTIRDV